MVKLLLDATVHEDGIISFFEGAISEAVFRGHMHIVKLTLGMSTVMRLDYQKLYFGALVDASHRGQEQIVRALLKAGLPTNEMGHDLYRALCWAAGDGYEQITKLLLEAGANVNAIGDGIGESALQRASSGGHDTVVRLLLEAGASTSRHRGLFYGSALQKASERGHERVVELLLKAGAHVNTFGGRSGSALQGAGARDVWIIFLQQY